VRIDMLQVDTQEPRNVLHPQPAKLQFSHRELNILRLMPGCTNGEIAKTLHTSEASVVVSLKHLFGKMGVKNRAEAVVWAAGPGAGTALGAGRKNVG
jgi:DNA-binding NarL/FixJ family response regulator